MQPRQILTLASVAAALGLSACSGGTGTTEPTATSESAPPTSEATDPALKVDQPKNLKAITDACQLLTPEQLTTLGASAGPEPDTTAYGESKCSWINDSVDVAVALNTATGSGPAEIYEDAGASDNFAPTKVGGYPAARVDAQSTLCRIEVGGGYGQNIAMGAESNFQLTDGQAITRAITRQWYNNEFEIYPAFGTEPSQDKFEEWGHLSQILWKKTEKIGCAIAMCDPGELTSNLEGYFAVCNYEPAGRS